MTFYFYDVETTGFSPRSARVMQFAGQRTDLNLRPVGQPDNFIIKLSDDILPDPDAVLIHGITPQQTKTDGLTEAEFLRRFIDKICQPDTIITGYNNIRFDDQFMRFMLWRNFYDAYEWQWKDKRSKWDLLDVVRMTRALRPEGIKWPVDSEGKPSNRLELISGINELDHALAHDALSDVKAAIAVARLVSNKQPKLFDYLLKLRDKTNVEVLVNKGDPLIYTSGRYPSEFEKTTIVAKVGIHPQGRGAFVYDLRADATDFLKLEVGALASAWQNRDKDAPYFPVKLLTYNRCPAIAPLSVLDDNAVKRLKIDLAVIEQNLQKIRKNKEIEAKLVKAHELIQPKAQPKLVLDEQQVDEQLYDGFVSEPDKTKMSVVRAARETELADLKLDFSDERLQLLLPLYKARNFPEGLSNDEKVWWEHFRTKKLLDGGEKSRAARYFRRIEELKERPGLSGPDRYLLEDLAIYGQSVIPAV